VVLRDFWRRDGAFEEADLRRRLMFGIYIVQRQK
jgi:hypothetical protein